jgi:hypothetical protein
LWQLGNSASFRADFCASARGDCGAIEMTPYDLAKGRITYRFK